MDSMVKSNHWIVNSSYFQYNFHISIAIELEKPEAVTGVVLLFCEEKCPKLSQISQKNACGDLKVCNFIKRRFKHRCFPVEFSKLLRAPIREQLRTTASLKLQRLSLCAQLQWFVTLNPCRSSVTDPNWFWFHEGLFYVFLDEKRQT